MNARQKAKKYKALYEKERDKNVPRIAARPESYAITRVYDTNDLYMLVNRFGVDGTAKWIQDDLRKCLLNSVPEQMIRYRWETDFVDARFRIVADFVCLPATYGNIVNPTKAIGDALHEYLRLF